jgi:hypothetical protein
LHISNFAEGNLSCKLHTHAGTTFNVGSTPQENQSGLIAFHRRSAIDHSAAKNEFLSQKYGKPVVPRLKQKYYLFSCPFTSSQHRETGVITVTISIQNLSKTEMW